MKPFKLVALATALTAVATLSGCASVFNDSRQRVTIKSIPDGAEVIVDGRTVTTPTTLDLKGRQEYYLTASKPGYRQTAGKIEGDMRIGSGVVGNVFSFGIIGMAVDFFGTGAGWKLQPEITLNLQADPAQAPVAAPVQPQAAN